jgi:hypothetical protein
MRATLLRRDRIVLPSEAIVEMVVWRVPKPLPGSAHGFKYRFAYVVSDECVLRYDNEAGKGDHKHVRTREVAVTFSNIDELIAQFIAEVERLEGL